MPFSHLHSYSNLWVFGCLCFVHLPPQEWNKLSAQAANGYNDENNVFFVMTWVLARCMRISCHVVFLENICFFKFLLHLYYLQHIPSFETSRTPRFQSSNQGLYSAPCCPLRSASTRASFFGACSVTSHWFRSIRFLASLPLHLSKKTPW